MEITLPDSTIGAVHVYITKEEDAEGNVEVRRRLNCSEFIKPELARVLLREALGDLDQLIASNEQQAIEAQELEVAREE